MHCKKDSLPRGFHGDYIIINMERLFVYGSLAPGKSNHHIIKDIPGTWDAATIKGKLFQEGWGAYLGYPGVIPNEDGDIIEGYLFSSDQLSTYWDMLDAFEGDGYVRQLVTVISESGELVEAYIYAINRSF